MVRITPQNIGDAQRHENWSDVVYPDDEGYATQGWGRHHGINFGDPPITRPIGDLWLLQDLMAADMDALHIVGPVYDQIDEVRRGAILDPVFNMGAAVYAQFVPMIKAIQAQDWLEAAWHLAVNMSGALQPYTIQVKQRAIDNCLRLATGLIRKDFIVGSSV